MNYFLTIIEFGWFHSRNSSYFKDKLSPIMLLVVSFWLATQTFALYKYAVVFDDEGIRDVFIQQEIIDDCQDKSIDKTEPATTMKGNNEDASHSDETENKPEKHVHF